jgi:hypothetical protein
MNSIMLVIAMNTCTISNQIDTQPPEQYLELLLLEATDETSDSICVYHTQLFLTTRSIFMKTRFDITFAPSLDLIVPFGGSNPGGAASKYTNVFLRTHNVTRGSTETFPH